MSNDGHSTGTQTVIIGVVFTVMAAAIVSLRLFIRLVVVQTPGWDDCLIFFSLATSVTLTALTVKQVHYGLGRHYESLSPEVLMENLKALWAAVVVYYISLAFVKTSVIVQYLRIFVDRPTRIACWVVLTVITIYSLTTIFGAAFTCYPVRFFWDKSGTEEYTCLDQKALWFANASLNIISDLVVLICPIPALRKLQLPRRQKIGVMLVFALGGITVVMSILRLHSLYVISVSTDLTWDNVGAATWSMVELNTGITCACLPMLKSLISRFFPRLLGSSRHASTRGREPDTVMGAYLRQTSQNPRTDPSHNSSYMADTKRPGICTDIRGANDAKAEEGTYGNEIQVTTVVEVEHHGEDYLGLGTWRGGSANTSERNLVLPVQKS